MIGNCLYKIHKSVIVPAYVLFDPPTYRTIVIISMPIGSHLMRCVFSKNSQNIYNLRRTLIIHTCGESASKRMALPRFSDVPNESRNVSVFIILFFLQPIFRVSERLPTCKAIGDRLRMELCAKIFFRNSIYFSGCV